MQPTPRRSKWLALLGTGLSVCLMLLAPGPPGSRADDKPPPGVLPAEVARLVRWLPEDTENLIVAGPMTLDRAGDNIFEATRWSDFGRSAAAAGVDLDEGQPLAVLSGRKVARVVRGGRNPSPVGKAGGVRAEGCAIVVFEADLPDAGRGLIDRLRAAAPAVRTVAGREAFVAPPPTHQEPGPWKERFVTLLRPDTLLVATSEPYLEAVLRRAEGPEPAPGRALPDNLPEWRAVERDAPAWMIRHFAAPALRRTAVGVAVAYRDDGLRVVFVPRPGAEPDLEQVADYWRLKTPPGFDLPPPPGDRFRVERRPDGAAALVTEPLRLVDDLWLLWAACYLEEIEASYRDYRSP